VENAPEEEGGGGILTEILLPNSSSSLPNFTFMLWIHRRSGWTSKGLGELARVAQDADYAESARGKK